MKAYLIIRNLLVAIELVIETMVDNGFWIRHTHNKQSSVVDDDTVDSKILSLYIPHVQVQNVHVPFAYERWTDLSYYSYHALMNHITPPFIL